MSKNSKAIVFDLDGTLYDTKVIDELNKRAGVRAIQDSMKINHDQAIQLFLKTKAETHSTSGAVTKLGVPEDVFKKHQLELIKPQKYITPDAELCSLIKRLKSRFKLVLFTNTRKEIANKILDALGFVEGDFDLILAGGDFQPPKPSILIIGNILKSLSVEASESFAVGDRWDVDLEPALEVGMKIKHVDSRNELITWMKSL